MNRKQLIAALESRRFWIAVLGVAEAVNQAAGLHVPGNVFTAIEAFIGLLFTGDTVVSAVHAANVHQPEAPANVTVSPTTNTVAASTQPTMGTAAK